MTSSTRILAAAVGTALILTVGACGGDDGGLTTGRPTANQFSIKFRNEIGYPPARAGCLGQALVDSDLSDQTVRDIYNADLTADDSPFSNPDFSEDEAAAAEALNQELAICFGEAPPDTAPADPGATDDATDPDATDTDPGQDTRPDTDPAEGEGEGEGSTEDDGSGPASTEDAGPPDAAADG